MSCWEAINSCLSMYLWACLWISRDSWSCDCLDSFSSFGFSSSKWQDRFLHLCSLNRFGFTVQWLGLSFCLAVEMKPIEERACAFLYTPSSSWKSAHFNCLGHYHLNSHDQIIRLAQRATYGTTGQLFRPFQQCIPWSPPLENEPATTECRPTKFTGLHCTPTMPN